MTTFEDFQVYLIAHLQEYVSAQPEHILFSSNMCNSGLYTFVEAVEDNSQHLPYPRKCKDVVRLITDSIKLFGNEWKEDVMQSYKDNLY